MSFFQNQNTNNQTGGSAQPSGLFGTSGTTSGGSGASNVFGGPASGSGVGGLFGGGNMGGAPGTGAGSGGSLFGGGSTTNNPTPSNPLMAGFNTTPGVTSGGTNTQPSNSLPSSANPPSTGTGGGLFGSAPTPNPSNPLFGGGGSATGNATASSGTGGGLFGGGSAPNPSNSLFGGGKTPASSGSNTLLGGLTNPLFGGAKPADQGGTETSKPAGSDFFSKPPNTSTTAASGSSTLPTGGLFGSSVKPAETAQAPSSGTTATTTPSGGLFGGGNIFGKKTDQPALAASSAAAPASSLFGNKDSAPAKDGAATASGGLGGLFGNKDKPTENTSSAAATSTFGTFGAAKAASGERKDVAGDKPKEATVSTSLGLGAPSTSTATVPPVPPPSMLRGKTIEEMVNRWSSELDNHVREFNKFAGEVLVWDRALIENGNNLAALYSHVLAAEREQDDIDQSLDHIEQQQKDLTAALDAYEKSSQDILGGQGGGLRALDTGPADTERDKNYTLATDLHTHLDDLSGSLTKMIDSVNAVSLPSASGSADATKTPSGEDPMAQIAQILSSHLESLQWIDGAVGEVEGKVSEVEKQVKDSGLGSPSSNGGAMKPRGFGVNR